MGEIIEMIHTASLIHDDVLDESDMRRGEFFSNSCFHMFHGTVFIVRLNISVRTLRF